MKTESAHIHSLAARCLERGIGRKTNTKAAAILYERTCHSGNLLSMHNLGVFLWKGVGVQKPDKSRAIKLFRAAAERGHIASYQKLGFAYEEGCDALKSNIFEAIKWYRKAVEGGCAWSMYRLALCYMEGRGVPINNEVGIELLQISAAQGLNIAKEILCSVSNVKMGTPRRLLPALVALEVSDNDDDDNNEKYKDHDYGDDDDYSRPRKKFAHDRLDALARVAVEVKKAQESSRVE